MSASISPDITGTTPVPTSTLGLSSWAACKRSSSLLFTPAASRFIRSNMLTRGLSSCWSMPMRTKSGVKVFWESWAISISPMLMASMAFSVSKWAKRCTAKPSIGQLSTP